MSNPEDSLCLRCCLRKARVVALRLPVQFYARQFCAGPHDDLHNSTPFSLSLVLLLHLALINYGSTEGKRSSVQRHLMAMSCIPFSLQSRLLSISSLRVLVYRITDPPLATLNSTFSRDTCVLLAGAIHLCISPFIGALLTKYGSRARCREDGGTGRRHDCF